MLISTRPPQHWPISGPSGMSSESSSSSPLWGGSASRDREAESARRGGGEDADGDFLLPPPRSAEPVLGPAEGKTRGPADPPHKGEGGSPSASLAFAMAMNSSWPPPMVPKVAVGETSIHAP